MGELMRWPWRSAAPARDEVRDLMREFLTEDDQGDELVWDTITVKDGLPHNWIYDIFVDSTGRVWAGTWGGGLGVYENGTWTVYDRRDGLASVNVTCVREDARGRIWASTDAGLNRLEKGRFVDAGLAGNSLLNLTFDREQNLWAGCWRHAGRATGGLYVAEGAGGQSLSAGNRPAWRAMPASEGAPGSEVLKVFEDSRGDIWAGTYDGGQGAGVGRWDGSRWRRYTSRDGLAGDCVYSMFEDPRGHMWFGTTNGVSIYDGAVWRTLKRRDGLANDHVYAMFIDTENKMWFGTGRGVSRFDGTNWTTFARRSELPAGLVRAIAQDHDGCLWFGTYPFTPGRGGIGRARKPDVPSGIENRIVGYLERGANKEIEGG